MCLCTIGKKQLWPLHPKRCYSTHPLLQSNTWNLKQLKCVHAKKKISIWIGQNHNSTSTYAYNTTKGQINIMLTCGGVCCFLKSRTSEASPTKTLIKMATSNSSALINISNAFSTTLVVLCFVCARVRSGYLECSTQKNHRATMRILKYHTHTERGKIP